MSIRGSSGRNRKPINYAKLHGDESSDDDDFVNISPPNKKQRPEISKIKPAEKEKDEKLKQCNQKRLNVNERAFERHLETALAVSRLPDEDDDDFIPLNNNQNKLKANDKSGTKKNDTKNSALTEIRIGIQPIQLNDDDPTTETSCSSSEDDHINKKRLKKKLSDETVVKYNEDLNVKTLLNEAFSDGAVNKDKAYISNRTIVKLQEDELTLRGNCEKGDSDSDKTGKLESMPKEAKHCLKIIEGSTTDIEGVDSSKLESKIMNENPLTLVKDGAKCTLLSRARIDGMDGADCDETKRSNKENFEISVLKDEIAHQNVESKNSDVEISSSELSVVRQGRHKSNKSKGPDCEHLNAKVTATETKSSSKTSTPLPKNCAKKSFPEKHNNKVINHSSSSTNYVKPVNLPNLGLRLGLSRKAVIKPLHSSVKTQL